MHSFIDLDSLTALYTPLPATLLNIPITLSRNQRRNKVKRFFYPEENKIELPASSLVDEALYVPFALDTNESSRKYEVETWTDYVEGRFTVPELLLLRATLRAKSMVRQAQIRIEEHKNGVRLKKEFEYTVQNSNHLLKHVDYAILTLMAYESRGGGGCPTCNRLNQIADRKDEKKRQIIMRQVTQERGYPSGVFEIYQDIPFLDRLSAPLLRTYNENLMFEYWTFRTSWGLPEFERQPSQIDN